MGWTELVGGGVLLYFGAEWFVAGASGLALSLRVPELLVGLTVVAYGTSAPEIVVGVQAARAGHGAVALGNVLGSNIANIGLILGIAALIRPARVDGELRKRELPALLASAACLPLLLIDGVVSSTEAVMLLAVALGYTIWMIRAARSASALATARQDAAATGRAADAAGAPRAAGRWRACGITAGGLAILLLGGHLFVNGAVEVAQTLGMSERLLGLTIVAVGTSLPELVTSVIAARKGHSELAVGNVVGSNIFNSFLCLGAAALTGSVGGPLQAIAVDVSVLLAMTVIAAVFIRSERTITRLEGAFVLSLYLVFMAFTLWVG
ncbi:MAG TPA: calcium/sodium antiporter [Polyangiaceae bacterium]